MTLKRKKIVVSDENQHLRALVAQAIENRVLFDYVLTDNWFGAKDNGEFIHYELNKFFVFGMKANRLIALSEKERKKGQYQNLNTLDFKDGQKRVVWIKDLAFSVALITKIFKTKMEAQGFYTLLTMI